MMKTKTVRKKLSKIEESAFKEAQLRESDLRKQKRVKKASTTQNVDASDDEDSELMLPEVEPKAQVSKATKVKKKKEKNDPAKESTRA